MHRRVVRCVSRRSLEIGCPPDGGVSSPKRDLTLATGSYEHPSLIPCGSTLRSDEIFVRKVTYKRGPSFLKFVLSDLDSQRLRFKSYWSCLRVIPIFEFEVRIVEGDECSRDKTGGTAKVIEHLIRLRYKDGCQY